jgi:hypothetical protein
MDPWLISFCVFAIMLSWIAILHDHLTDQQNRPQSHQQQPADPQKDVAKPTIGPPDLRPAAPHHEAPKREWYKTPKGRIRAREWAVFYIGIAAITIYFGQLIANRRQAKAAEAQLKEMNRESRADLRAWVFKTDLTTFDGSTHGTFRERVTVKNIGKTPAMMRHGYVSQRIVQEPVDMFALSNDLSKPDIFSDNFRMDTILPQEAVSYCFSQDLSITLLQLAQSNLAAVVFFGAVEDDDIYGDRHWSQYCYMLESNISLADALPFHNGMGDSGTNDTR